MLLEVNFNKVIALTFKFKENGIEEYLKLTTNWLYGNWNFETANEVGVTVKPQAWGVSVDPDTDFLTFLFIPDQSRFSIEKHDLTLLRCPLIF